MLGLPSGPLNCNNSAYLKAKTQVLTNLTPTISMHFPQNLILQKNHLRFTVFPYKGHYIYWKTTEDICGHLSFLLETKVSSSDMTNSEPLNGLSQTQKTLVTFKASTLLALIMKWRKQLSQWGVFPICVFNNQSVLPLFYKASTCIDSPSDKNSSLKLPLQNFSNTLISLEPHPPNFIKLDNSVEDLLQSFKNLPSSEQVAITDRHEVVRNKLIESKEQHHLMDLSQHTSILGLSEFTPCQNHQNKQSHLTKQEKIPQTYPPIGPLCKNGCVFEDADGQLDLISIHWLPGSRMFSPPN